MGSENEPPGSAPISKADLGRDIRRRRRALDKTLKEVADEVGVSIGFLSQVERGVSTPSLSSLHKIAEALGMSVASFIAPWRHPSVVTRNNEREVFTLGDPSRKYELMGRGFPGAQLNACLVHREPGQVSEVMRNAGEEFVFILEGSVRYEIAGETHVLQKGDSMHFQSDQPHRTSTVGETTAVELWVGTLPVFK